MELSSDFGLYDSQLTLDGLNILIIEDDPDCAYLLQRLLARLGHNVRSVLDGFSALDEVDAVPPDVVLLDIGLYGMDGYEVASLLRERSSEKPPFIIALSGYADDEDRREQAGIDLHLVKPVEPEDLRCLLARFQRVIAQVPMEVQR